MLLYIVRHGDPNYKDDCLTARGKLQAEAVGRRIAASKIDRIFSSPMGRARETAAPACRLLGLEMQIEDWSHEILSERLTPFPDGNPKSVSVIQNTYYRAGANLALDYNHSYEADGFSTSGMKEATEYIAAGGRDFLERLGYREEGENYRIIRPNEERVALFCHSAMARAWLSVLLHIPIHIMWASFGYNHTGVTVLKFANNENGITAPQCLCYSDMSHLYAHGPDMGYDKLYLNGEL